MAPPRSLPAATTAALLLLPLLALAALVPAAVAMTLPDQAARMIAYRDAVRVRSPSWAEATRDWTCPTPTSAAPVCDLCGPDWQGRWQHVSCRGKTRGWGESGDGTVDGVVNSIHTTSVNLDGAIPKELCVNDRLRQLDVGGRSGAGRLVGPIEPWIAECWVDLEEIDLSMNRLTGTLPPALAAHPRVSELKVEGNNLVGTIDEAFGRMARLRRLQLEQNNFEGTIPQSFANKNTSAQLTELHIASNNLTGDLRPLRGVRLFTVTVHDNPGLCGMVPAGVRYAAGYNPEGTRLGQPC
jgi:hypothetical protein